MAIWFKVRDLRFRLMVPDQDFSVSKFSFRLRPHPPSPSPKGKERCNIAKPNFISPTSSVYLYSAFSKLLIIF